MEKIDFTLTETEQPGVLESAKDRITRLAGFLVLIGVGTIIGTGDILFGKPDIQERNEEPAAHDIGPSTI